MESVIDLETFFFNQHPSLKEVDARAYHEIFERLGSLSVQPEIISDVLTELKNRSQAIKLATDAFEFSQGNRTLDELRSTVVEFNDQSEKGAVPIEAEFVTDDLLELYESSIKEPGLSWRLHSLNISLGPLRKGDFGFVFARPETGKTTFLASEITHMASIASAPVLWFNNEEQGRKVMLRCFQSALGIKLVDLFSNLENNNKQFHYLTNNNIKLYDGASIHRNQVELICKQIKPALIVFDQIDKIKGFQNDRDDLRLGSIYIWARELAKEFAPVIGICQADGTAEGKQWLTMDHVANAKTSKQAEADWILGIGKVHDPLYENIRYLNISKNKLAGSSETLEEYRHGKFSILIKPEIARYSEIGE